MCYEVNVGTQRPLAVAGAGPGAELRHTLQLVLGGADPRRVIRYQGLGFDVLADAAPVVVVDVWREEHRLQKPRQ